MFNESGIIMQKRKSVGEMLKASGLVTENDISVVLRSRQENEKLGDALIREGYITEQDLLAVLSEQSGTEIISLYKYELDVTLLKFINEDFARKNYVIPLRVQQNKLFVALADPFDYLVLDHLRMVTGLQLVPKLALKNEIMGLIVKYYGITNISDSILSDIVADNEKEVEKTIITNDDSPIIKLVNQIFESAVTNRTSDIHFDPRDDRIEVRFRIDGDLRLERVLPKEMQATIESRIKIMSKLDITEKRLPQDGRIRLKVLGKEVDVRVSTLPTVYGEKIVLRLLDLSKSLNELTKLGFTGSNLKKMNNLLNKPVGIILVTGPTGSGKSSTLYSSLSQLNKENVNIITVEDPVEMQIDGVNQIQVNDGIGLTFAAGLRSILRQDPNIVMVGEIRDSETAEIAVRASLTGHLVLSTIHTNDSISTISRLVDMGIEPFLISASTIGILAQRLVKRICPHCGKMQPVNKLEKDFFEKIGLDKEEVNRGEGCSHCNMTGYIGRVAIVEILEINENIRREITGNRDMSAIRKYAIENGMRFILEDGVEKIIQGITTVEEVLRVTTLE